MTESTLLRFDDYVAELRTTRSRDEEKDLRAAELLTRMQQQNQSLTELMNTLSRRVEAIPDLAARETTDQALSEIRDITSSLSENVRSIADTLTALSEEV